MLYSIVAVLVLVLDQAVKFYTVNNIEPKAIGDACKTLIPGVIHMTNVQNYGAAFSILENAQTALIVVSIVFIVGIIALICMDIIHTKFGRWTAVLVMAGALGNCIDRVLLGYVVDMFEFELFNFAVFNVADVFITVCGILFCIHVIVYREPEEERNAVPRPERTPRKALASRSRRKAAEEDAAEAETEAVTEAPARPAKHARREKAEKVERAERAKRAEKAEKAPARQAVRETPAPRKERRVHRTLEEELRPIDPNDPFAEWDSATPAAQSGHEGRSADEQPAERRTAPAVEDTPRKPAKHEKPAAAPVQEPAEPVQAEPEPNDAGFDEYSLDDILAEFRDS